VAERRTLSPSAVHVWLTAVNDITDTALLEAYAALMTDDERQRQQRFALEKGRRAYLLTRALARTTLSRYADVAPQDWRFVIDERGKPEIAPGLCPVPLRFNLSHTNGLIACAVTGHYDLGVDVEWMMRRTNTVAIADRYFAPFEANALRRLPQHRQRERFFELWCLKEAYIKARGLGLAIPLGQFWLHLDEGERIEISFDSRLRDRAQDWQLARFRPTPEHRLAVAIRRGTAADQVIDVRNTIPLRD